MIKSRDDILKSKMIKYKAKKNIFSKLQIFQQEPNTHSKSKKFNIQRNF